MNRKIPLFKVNMPKGISVDSLLHSGFIGQGSYVDGFENKFAQHFKLDVDKIVSLSCIFVASISLLGVDEAKSSLSFKKGQEAYLIYDGLEGLIDNKIKKASHQDVAGIVHIGGTIMRSSRSKRFFEHEYRQKAFDNLKSHGIQGVVVLGGDGSFRAMEKFSSEFDINFVGIPSTIDNDIYGTDYCLGVDTALNVIRDALDKIRDTAASHDRLFIVEVMGRDAGFIALEVGICGGAEEILVPETKSDLEELGQQVDNWKRTGKNSSLIIVAEGDDLGNAHTIADKLYEKYHVQSHVCVLGHTQRGGSPSSTDRLLATRLGYYAVQGIIEGKTDVMVGIINNKKVYTPLKESWENKKELDPELLKIYRIMSS